MAENSTIWLKPKPSHIDENFEDFLAYLKSGADKGSALYEESINLLDDRVNQLIDKRVETPVYRHSADIDECRFNVRLCCAWLLVIDDADYYAKKLVILTVINNLIQICQLSKKDIGNIQSMTDTSIDPLIDMAINLAKCKIPKPFILSWSDIIQPYEKKSTFYSKTDTSPIWSVDKFLTNFLKNEFTEPEESYFDGNGSLNIHNGNIDIAPVAHGVFRQTLIGNSLEENTLISALNINAYSDRKFQIKECKANDVDAIENCIDSIIEDMHKRSAQPEKKQYLKKYANDDLVPIKIVKANARDFTVRTFDPNFEQIEGKLVFDKALHIFKENYPFELWVKALPVGTRIDARFIEGSKTFSVADQFADQIAKYVKPGDECSCKYYRDVNAEVGHYEYVTSDGYIMFLPLTPEQLATLDEERNAYVTIFGSYENKKKFKGCLKATFIEPSENPEPFDIQEALQSLVDDFVDEIRNTTVEDSRVEVIELDDTFVKELCYVLNAMQSREQNPIRRYRLLGIFRLLSELADFDKESQYAEYLSKYIKNLILFSQAEKNENKCIKSIEIPDGLEANETIASGTEILKILSCFALDHNDPRNAQLADYIDSDNPTISRTASLVQSYNRIKDLLDERTLKGIKRRILESLAMLVEGDSSLDLANRRQVSFGEEDDTREFKHSFLFAPNDAKEQRQEYTVCKAICGLMNNQGGVVYLGVGEDQDGIGRPVGLTVDLQELSRRFNVRPSLDDYVVYINRKGEEWLGETAWGYVHLNQIREHNIIKIDVAPYPYDVVSLTDGRFYLRKNNSTDEIHEESTLTDIRRRRQEALRKIDDKVINLQDAIKKGQTVRLIGYHSSNSGSITNRIVEPFALEGNEYVICYEPAEAKVKLFRISRIDQVKLTGEPWANKSKHKKPFIDIFNMAEDSANKHRVNVKLNLKLRAKNALCETYPKAALCDAIANGETAAKPAGSKSPTEVLASLTPLDNETWQLEATLTSLCPLKHFYLNYADSIEIIEAPGLLDEIRAYLRTFLPS